MASKFKKGDKVAQIVEPIKGEVVGFGVDDETGDLQVKVQYKVGKETHMRPFTEEELESVSK